MTQLQRALATGGTLFLALLIFASYGGAQTLTIVHSFAGGTTDGGHPLAPLVIGSGGVLYGTTCEGGTSNNGTVFSLTPPASPGGSWDEAVLYSFTGTPNDGACPSASLVIGSGGVLYGVTGSGGSGQCFASTTCGTAFSLTPPASPGGAWTETILHNFMGGSDGAYPGSLVIGSGGVLYGTTAQGGTGVVPDCTQGGCGTVFSLAPPAAPGGAWTETLLHTFDAIRSGAYPGPVMIDTGGVLYGTLAQGANPGCGLCGAVFSLTPPKSPGGAWVARMVYRFKGPPTDGDSPSSLLLGSGRVIYGTTESGGAHCAGCGTVFSLTPPASPGAAWTEALLQTFSNSSIGNYYTVAMGSGGVFYGTSNVGGSATNSACVIDQCGTLFSLTPPSVPGGAWTEAVLHNFAGPPSDGDNPGASLVLGSGGVLYGTTNNGGASNAGTVFALRP